AERDPRSLILGDLDLRKPRPVGAILLRDHGEPPGRIGQEEGPATLTLALLASDVNRARDRIRGRSRVGDPSANRNGSRLALARGRCYITREPYSERHAMKQTALAPPSIDLIFRAFSDRTRLRILFLLQGG